MDEAVQLVEEAQIQGALRGFPLLGVRTTGEVPRDHPAIDVVGQHLGPVQPVVDKVRGIFAKGDSDPGNVVELRVAVLQHVVHRQGRAILYAE